MILQLTENIDVLSIYTRSKGGFLPKRIRWRGKVYKNLKLGYHHTVKIGNVLHHIFHVANVTLAFRLNFDTEVLSWTLTEVSDGLAD